MKEATEWYLKKKNNTQYGPVSIDELALWAKQCRIVAGNQASQDQEHWTPVEDIPELEMDWFAQRQDGKRYGPFPLAAVTALVEHHVIPDDALLTNRASGETLPMQAALSQRSQQPAPEQATKTAQKDRSPGPETSTPGKQVGTAPRNKQTQSTEPKDESSPMSEEATPKDNRITDQVQQEIADLQKQIKDLLRARKEQKQQAEQDIATLQTEFETLKSEALDQHQKAQARQNELATQVEELQEALAAEQASTSRDQEHNSDHKALVDELRQQVAFMKKNTAALHAQLSTAQETAMQRAKMLAGAWVVVTLVTAALIMSLLARGCQRPPQIDHPTSVSQTSPDTSEALPPIIERDSEDRPTQQIDAAPPLQGIEIEGIEVLSQDADALSLRFNEGIFSSLDTLSTDGRQLLDALARQLPRELAGWKLIIEGHTDDIPLRSTSRFADNEELAKARAEATAQHFKQRAGFPESAIDARPGTTAPFPNDSTANRTRNRTVTIEVKRRNNG